MKNDITWITMAKSNFEHEIQDFAKKMSSVLKQHEAWFMFKATAPTFGKLLFNNNNSNSKIGKFQHLQINLPCL